VDGPWQFDGQPDRLVVGERAAPCVASSALIGFEYEIPVDDHTHRKSRPDREHRLDVEIAADDLLAGLVDALGCALTQSRNESALVGVRAGWPRGEPRVSSMVPIPTEADEEARRAYRE
jgi:hypothetical protein